MVHVEKHFFNVPESRESDRRIQLEGLVLEPHSPKGKLIFVQGFQGSFGFYEEFLRQLAERFVVITYYQRGTGNSEGSLIAQGGNDLVSIIASEGVKEKDGKVAVVAHSMGAAFSLQAAAKAPETILSAYLINPYLGSEFLPGTRRYGPAVLWALSHTGIVTVAARTVPSERWQHKLGLLIRSNKMAKIKVPKGLHGIPAAFALADYDQVLGTVNNERRYDYLVRKVKESVPEAKDFSFTIRGLNHFLTAPGEGWPFARRASTTFISSVVKFAESAYNVAR